MDIVLTADGRSVAERFGNRLDALGDRFLGRFLADLVVDLRQFGEGQNGSAPGSEILLKRFTSFESRM